MNKMLIPFLLMILSGSLSGQLPYRTEQGSPFVKNFSPAEYAAHAQNFSIVRDKAGMLYFGNFAGVLQYDGEFWRLIPTEKTTKVSALAASSDGKIFVGASGEIGMLDTGPAGSLSFRSLIPAEDKRFFFTDDVLKIFSDTQGIWFITKKSIFLYHDGKLEVFPSDHEIISAFQVRDQLFLQIKEKGLVRYQRRQVIAVPHGEMVSGAIEIKAMLPYPDQKILIATGTQGLFLLDSKGVSEFDNPANAFFMKSLITCGAALSDGSYAIGTSRNGVIVISSDGTLLQIIDKKASLRSENVQELFTGGDNLLWAALNNGIAMLGIPDPLTFFDEKSGLNGAVNRILRHQDRLYVCTYQGLYYYDARTFGFLPVPEIITACWAIVPFGKDLLVATSQGVYKVSGFHASLIKEGFVLSIVDDSNDPTTFYTGEMKGLWCLRHRNGSWISQRIEGPGEEINDLIRDQSGFIWGSTMSGGVFRYAPATGQLRDFDTASGLPETTGSSINRIGGTIGVATRDGLYLFDDRRQSFFKKNLTGSDSTGGQNWYSIIMEDTRGNLWVNSGDESNLKLVEKKGDHYEIDQTPFLPIADYAIWTIDPEPSGITWVGGPDGVIRYDPAVKRLQTRPHPTLIRMIRTTEDSVISQGETTTIDPKAQKKMSVLKYSDNSLWFEFAAPNFSPKGKNQYQYRLEGFDETWSDWSFQTHKEYTNLPKGNYIFRVKAKNVYGQIAPEAQFSFRILSPWYTSWWAFVLYILFAAAVVYLILLIRNRQLIAEKKMLEQKIEERTAEVVQQKEEIEKQSDELAGKNYELEKINTTVKSINSEINFENLLQTLLQKMKAMKAVEKSAALVYDKKSDAFRFKAASGWDLKTLEHVKLSLAEAEKIYLADADELYEDIFLKTNFSQWETFISEEDTEIPKTMLILVIRVENRVEAFLNLYNMHREHAFEAKDLSFLRNSKEHVISAFIRTRILEDLQNTLQNLKDTQDQLIQSEKLASLGALTAGIAHEIQNPLNFVNNFSSLSADLADELSEFMEELKEKLSPDKYADMEEVIGMIKGNVKKINEHGKRAESIVKGMLQHSRGKTGEFEMTDINNLVSEYVNLAYHGMRAKDKSFNTSIKTKLDPETGKAAVIPQELSRVILNVVNNACYALDEKTKKHIPGFTPEVIISTQKVHERIEIRIRDNGTGIPDAVREKIFNPFFTTKPTGKGTGLGLSMSFDIVTQMHKGKLEVQSKEGEFTEFIITIPEKQT